MSILKVPDAGLQLESSARSSDFLPMQAFGITLNDGMIEDMIKCFENGQKIELELGSNPAFHYRNQEHRIKHTPDSYDYDLYLTNSSTTSSKAQRLPNPTMGIFQKPHLPKKTTKPQIRVEKNGANKQGHRAGSSGPDSEAEVFSSSYAREKAQKSSNSTKIVNKVPTEGKRGKGSKSKQLLPPGKSAMAAALSSSNTTTRSLPSSPAIHGAASPSLNPAYTATQQLHEKNKEQRSTLVHELAVRDRTYDYLASRWPGSASDLNMALGRVADETDENWSMKKLFWKELDVWNYEYETQEERQSAIDNAVRQYDRQRLGTMAPEWERLLKKEDRGKGIILSKLQATLAKGNITPLPKMSKADDGGKNDSDEGSKNKGGEAMARSSSQPVNAKPKVKGSEREAQTKRLLSNNPKKATPVPKKTATSKVKAGEKAGKKILSEEYIQDSSSEDEVPLSVSISKPKPAEKPLEKLVEKHVERPAERFVERAKQSPAPAPAPKPKAKPVVRAPKAMPPKAAAAPQKRSREDEDSSSSSGTPLAKRLKPKDAAPRDAAPKPAPKSNTLKHRPSDASQNSRGNTTSSNISMNRSKNTSPAKSSPLASSPPTNASDLDDSGPSQGQSQHHRRTTNGLTNGSSVTKKRRERESEDSMPAAKRVNISDSVLLKARKFERFYKKYEELHHDLTAVRDPPPGKLDDLLEMRERLVGLKAEIAREVASAA